jgi:hypothetical protein
MMTRAFLLTAATAIATTIQQQLVHAQDNSGSTYLNVYGDTLQPCSSQGMALTGYTRTGKCVDQYDDQGSHHICIDMSSSNDANGNNFCQVTGQDDWCAEAMPCDTVNGNGGNNYYNNNNGGYCAIQNWCVCQWAFASYIQTAGGCDFIQDIVCESVNLEAVLAYQRQVASASDTYGKYEDALQCLVNRCGLDVDNLPQSARSSSASDGLTAFVPTSTGTMSIAILGVLLVGVGAAIVFFVYQRFRLDRKAEHQSYFLQQDTPGVAS